VPDANVLSRRSRPVTKSYRAAVKQIILNLQASQGLNDAELGERLGCSAQTIRNARSEANNMDGVTLANVEYEFGPGAVDPFLRLGGSRAVPVSVRQAASVNPCLALVEALHVIIETQQEDSDGGTETTAREARKHVAKLRAARLQLDRMIALAEQPEE